MRFPPLGDTLRPKGGKSRLDNPKNKAFVAAWEKEYGEVPDNNEGEQWQCCQILTAGIQKAGTTDIEPLRAALETVEIDDIKGKVAMRACDHQVIQPGFIVRVTKHEGVKVPVPEVIATYPGDRTAPGCRKMVYED